MNLIKKGSTDVTRYVMLVDSSAGTPETAYTITSLDLQYTRNRTAPATKVDATALAGTGSAHGDNQAIEIDATSSPGLYRIDWPDAAFATGVDKVILVVSGTGLHPAIEEIQLVDFDPADAVRLGLTALPNAAADAAGGLPISDAGGLDLDAKLANTNEVTAARMGALTDWIDGGRLDLIVDAILVDTGTTLQAELDGIQADTEDIQTRLPAALLDGLMMSDVHSIRGDYSTGTNLADFFNGTGYAGTGNVIPTVTNVTNLHASAATSAALATAQADLDILTGSDGVTLATSQLNYAPATASALASLVTTVGVAGVGLTDLGGMSTTMKAQVNTEVVDALATDTYAEPTGAPGATVSLKDKIGYLYMALRNKLTITSSAKTFYDDGGSSEWSKGLADDGTTYTESEGS